MTKYNKLLFLGLIGIGGQVYAGLISAVKKHNIERVASYLRASSRHGDLNMQDSDGNTALIWAVRKDEKKMVKMLIEAGAAINTKSKKKEIKKKFVYGETFIRTIPGRTALNWAVEGGRNEIVELLLSAGADVAEQDNPGNSPLYLAVRRGDVEIAELLISFGAVIGVFYSGAGRIEPLYLGAGTGNVEMVRLLLNAGVVNVNEPRLVNGHTALFIAAGRGDKVIVRLLIERGADVNWQDRKGRTALYEVVDGGWDKVGVVEMLMKAGADATIQSNDGSTALDVAAGQKEILKLLCQTS